MPPVGRKIPKEVQAIFDKYTETISRRLKKPDAIKMMVEEFGVSEEQADRIFETFDQDKNGIMSIWEFQALYTTVGDSGAQEIVKKFEEMDKDGSGYLDAEEAKAGLKAMKTSTGRDFEEKEIDFFIRSNTGDDGMIDLGRFVQMLFRLKMYKPKK